LGLGNEKHAFTFEVDDVFFSHFDGAEIKKGKLQVNVSLQKNDNLLELHFFIEGYVSIQCHRCLDDFDMPLEIEETLYVKFGEETSDLSDIDKVMVLSHREKQLPLASHIYEYINLALPIKQVHAQEDDCNQEMLQRLDELTQVAEIEVDPRWNKLQNVINN